jgi:hypothetical protein
MFRKPKINEPTKLDNVIDNALEAIGNYTYEDNEFDRRVNQLAKLYKMKEQELPKRVSPDTLAVVGGNLAGILLILYYERAHVITSKAFNLIIKPR